MNDNPPTYTPLVLLKSSWRKIRKPSKETISKLYVGSSDQPRGIGRLLSFPYSNGETVVCAGGNSQRETFQK